MKNIFESEEVFTAYATIDACLVCLEAISKQIDKRTPIDKMIDKATGHDIALTKKALEEGIDIFETLIENKKIIEDPSWVETEKELTSMKQMLYSLTTPTDNN